MPGFSPYDAPLEVSQSDATDARFGGLREVVDRQIAKTEDYTSRTNASPNKEENPVDETTKDIDDLNNEEDRKRETSRRMETSTVGADNQYRRPGDGDDKIYSDPDNIPAEDTDPFIPDGDPIKLRRSKNKHHFGSGQYDNMPNRGAYEGENS